MAEYTSTPGVTSLNAALMHTLQRHRDILQVRRVLHLSLTRLTHSLWSLLKVSAQGKSFFPLSDFLNIYMDKGKTTHTLVFVRFQLWHILQVSVSFLINYLERKESVHWKVVNIFHQTFILVILWPNLKCCSVGHTVYSPRLTPYCTSYKVNKPI